MLQLKYAINDDKAAEVKDKLTSLSLAFKEEQADIAEITLEDGDTIVVGLGKISDYLNKIEGELHQWYYCDC